jgi:hypothetical protein
MKINKEYSRSVTEDFLTFKDVKSVYKIAGGWHEIAQGTMGWKTTCGKRVVSDESFGMKTYQVYWTDLISLP